MKIVNLFLLLAFFQACSALIAMNHVIGPDYLYGQWQQAKVEYKSFSREIHKELFCPLRARLIKSAHVKNIYACDTPDSLETMQVLIVTNHAINLGIEPPNFVKSTQMTNGVTKNIRKFLSAYVQLSTLYRWGYIESGQNDQIILTPPAQSIASAAAKSSLRRLCKRAQLKFGEIAS